MRAVRGVEQGSGAVPDLRQYVLCRDARLECRTRDVARWSCAHRRRATAVSSLIAQHVEQLGFRLSDVKVILNSHVHFDHAGGIAELQRLSGAKVIASERAASVLRTGQAAAARAFREKARERETLGKVVTRE